VHTKVEKDKHTYVGPTSVQSAHFLFALSLRWNVRIRSTKFFSLFFFIGPHLAEAACPVP